VVDFAQATINTIRGRKRLFDELSGRVRKVRQSTVKRRLADLELDRLDAIDKHLANTASYIVEKLETYEGKSEASIADGDWQRHVLLRGEAAEVARDFDELQDLRRRVLGARHERALNDALAERLGGDGRRKLYDGGIMVLIVLVVGMMMYELLAGPPPEVTMVLDWIDIVACCIFLADFTWRHRLAESKSWYWRRYWLDFITSIPLPSAHTLRLGRTVRLVRLVRVLRIARLARILRVLLFFWRGMDKLAAAFDVRLMRRSVNILLAILFIGALGIWLVEGAPTADGVEDFGQSMWWSFTTVVTGGFGDIYNPDSVGGRILTGGLVIAGMVVVGIFTATLTSLLVREGDASGAILALEDKVLDELQIVKAKLNELGQDSIDS